MSNEIDSSMKLLPYVDDKFVGYRNKSVQDFRFALSEGIRSQVFFATFVEKVENQIKSTSVINALKQAVSSRSVIYKVVKWCRK